MEGSARRLIISYNGEVYNFPELRRSLLGQGATFRTHSDTEVILELYARAGLEGLTRLRGMYALAIWDSRQRQLVVARDPFGIKPLYLWKSGARVVVASQVRALAIGLAERQRNPEAMLEYGLFGHVAGYDTPIAGIEEAPPGAVLCFVEGGQRSAPKQTAVRSLYDPLSTSARDDGAEIAAAVEESVAAHTLSDVPIGLLLSAGMDSAVVASRLAASGDPSLVKAFTIGFQGVDGNMKDEAPRAAKLAAALGFPSHSESITRNTLQDNLADYFQAMDMPTVDAVNTFFAARLVHKFGLKVALTGTGGDELFGGYPSFRRTPTAVAPSGRFAIHLGAIAAALGVSAPGFNARKLGWMAQAGRTLTGAYLVQRGLMEPAGVAREFDCDVAQVRRVFDRVHDTLHDDVSAIEDPWSAVSFLETRFYLMPRLLRDADWAGMAHSVELRTPLVDWVLWRRLRPVVAAAQQRRVRTKRRLMAPILAPGLLALLPSEKVGFGNPYRELVDIAGEPPAALPANAQQSWASFVLSSWERTLR